MTPKNLFWENTKTRTLTVPSLRLVSEARTLAWAPEGDTGRKQCEQWAVNMWPELLLAHKTHCTSPQTV